MRPTSVRSMVCLLAILAARSCVAAKYTVGVTDRMVCAPALVAQELGYWKELGLETNVALMADDEDLFNGVRRRFANTDDLDLAGRSVCRCVTLCWLFDSSTRLRCRWWTGRAVCHTSTTKGRPGRNHLEQMFWSVLTRAG